MNRLHRMIFSAICVCCFQNGSYADGPDTPLESATDGLLSVTGGPFMASRDVYQTAKYAKKKNISDYGELLIFIPGQWAYNSAMYEASGCTLLGAASVIPPVEMIKNFPHLSKANLSFKENENTYPTAQLSLQENGQIRSIAIPLKLSPHLIQMNQKLDDKPYENI